MSDIRPYRGKRLDNGEFVTGFYIELNDSFKKRRSNRIYSGYAESEMEDEDNIKFYPTWYEVDPNSVEVAE